MYGSSRQLYPPRYLVAMEDEQARSPVEDEHEILHVEPTSSEKALVCIYASVSTVFTTNRNDITVLKHNSKHLNSYELDSKIDR
jgi:hypothetical protein